METNEDQPERMLVSNSTGGDIFSRRSSSNDTIAPYQELIIRKKVFKRSVNCLRFAVFVDAVAGTIEQPNYRE
jgi:hypothetical protein